MNRIMIADRGRALHYVNELEQLSESEPKPQTPESREMERRARIGCLVELLPGNFS